MSMRARGNGGIIGPFVQTSPTSAPGVWTANDAAARLSAGGYIDGWPGATDPDFASVQFLTHFDPYPGKPAFYDVTANSTVAGVGLVNTSLAQAKFGSQALAVTVAGAYASVSNAGLALGSGDWTIEGWWYWTNTSGDGGVVDFRPALNGFYPSILFGGTGSGTPRTIVFSTNSASRITSANNTLVANTWKHWACAKASGSTILYYDGNQVGSTYTDGNTYIGNQLRIGVNSFTNTASGYHDEIRITKGVARYTGATYTVPTAPFPNNA